MTADSVAGGRPRRQVLRSGALAALTVPVGSGLLTACDGGYASGPDPLLPLLHAARADVDAARKLRDAGGGDTARLAESVARVRAAQARALHAEIDRLNRPAPESQPPTTPRPSGIAELAKRLPEARAQAATLVPELPAYRAGLTGSVAAGCAGLQEIAADAGTNVPQTSVRVEPAKTGELSGKAVGALQQALATEHAAIWVYGLVTAFLPAPFSAGIGTARAQHRERKQAAADVLRQAGAQPNPGQAAYVPAESVSGSDDAIRLVVTAETDAAGAWRGVLVRTEDPALRTMATNALVGSAARATRWRLEGNTRPAAVPLPGSR